jgi:Ca2+-binding EF-hand superfamily protein
MNAATKDILGAVNSFLKANGLSDPVKLFSAMDANGDGKVDQREFVDHFGDLKKRNANQGKKESALDKKLTPQALKNLFAALDADGSATLDLREFCAYIGYTEKLDQKKVANIDSETQDSLDNLVDRLFRKVDSNHNGYVDLAELYQLLKPLRPGSISEPECAQILASFDANNDG